MVSASSKGKGTEGREGVESPKLPQQQRSASFAVLANIPERGTSSETATPSRRLSPRPSQSLMGGPYSLGNSPNATSASGFEGYIQQSGTGIEPLTDTQKARIVGRHLANRQEQARSRKASSSQNRDMDKSTVDLVGKVKAAMQPGKSVEENALEDEEEDYGSDTAEGENGKLTARGLTPEEYPVSVGLKGRWRYRLHVASVSYVRSSCLPALYM